MERVKGIEPSCAAWKAAVLPLNYTRIRERGNEHSGIAVLVNAGIDAVFCALWSLAAPAAAAKIKNGEWRSPFSIG